jgi:hypothetical protein
MIRNYAERTPTGNADDYFEEAYDFWYKDILRKPYIGDYGIYCTVVDLFDAGVGNFECRFALNNNAIKKYDVICLIAKPRKIIFKVENINQLQNVFNDYNDSRKIRKLWNKSNRFKFVYFPQIVIFAGPRGVPVSKRNLECIEVR